MAVRDGNGARVQRAEPPSGDGLHRVDNHRSFRFLTDSTDDHRHLSPMIVDLHTHSTASDGSDPPERLVELAAQLGARSHRPHRPRHPGRCGGGKCDRRRPRRRADPWRRAVPRIRRTGGCTWWSSGSRPVRGRSRTGWPVCSRVATFATREILAALDALGMAITERGGAHRGRRGLGGQTSHRRRDDGEGLRARHPQRIRSLAGGGPAGVREPGASRSRHRDRPGARIRRRAHPGPSPHARHHHRRCHGASAR